MGKLQLACSEKVWHASLHSVRAQRERTLTRVDRLEKGLNVSDIHASVLIRDIPGGNLIVDTAAGHFTLGAEHLPRPQQSLQQRGLQMVPISADAEQEA